MKKVIYTIACGSLILLLTASVKAQSHSRNNPHSSQQQTTPKKNYSEEEITKIMDKNSYPDYDTDLAEINRLYELYKPTNDREIMAGQVEKLNSSTKRVEEIGNKYAEYWSVYNDQLKKMEPMQATYERLRLDKRKFGNNNTRLNEIQDEVDKKLKNQGNPAFVVPDMLGNAEKRAKENFNLLDKSDFKSAKYQDKQKMANSAWTSVNLDMADVNFTIALAKYKSGEESDVVKSLLQKRDATITNINNYKKDFNAKLISLCMTELSAIKPPAETYTGGDKEKFRKLIQDEWNKGYCKEGNTLVKIIFSGTKWRQDNRTIYSNTSSNGSVVTKQNLSNSVLDATIIYKSALDGQEILTEYEGYVMKDNNDGTYTYEICPHGGLEAKKILAKNVK